MKKLINKISQVFEMDRCVTSVRQKETFRVQQIVALIAFIGFSIMSAFNVKQDSIMMLWTTAGAALLFALAFGLSFIVRKKWVLNVAFFLILLILFPVYTIIGGNEGFAVLWMLLITYLVMYVVDFKIGLLTCALHQIFLILVFIGPFQSILRYEYNPTFMLRFPALYFVNFVFAAYICGTMRVYQFNLIQERKKYEDLSMLDLLTGAYNRNAYMTKIAAFNASMAKNVAVIYMDANGLHELNNSKGHDAGDDLIKTVVNESKNVFIGQDVYRVGGDEFVIFCKDVDVKTLDDKIDVLKANVERKDYSVSTGCVWFNTNEPFNLIEITKEANRIMLENKAAFYSNSENDRRVR